MSSYFPKQYCCSGRCSTTVTPRQRSSDHCSEEPNPLSKLLHPEIEWNFLKYV
ncbi:hypothetical protein HAX54_033389, partial [Datura stramonium]|nr:hypothetical protein [Datura stramonium]